VIPERVIAEALLRPRRELDPRLEAEQAVDLEAEVDAAGNLVADLLLGAEDVRVVLREGARAQQAVEGAGGLLAVQQAGLGEAQRQIAVGAGLHRVEHAVTNMFSRYLSQCPEIRHSCASKSCGVLTSV
jgi:hypothetical protein